MASLSHQRAPNNISIKIDTTEEYMRDEVSSARNSPLFSDCRGGQHYSPSSGELKSQVV